LQREAKKLARNHACRSSPGLSIAIEAAMVAVPNNRKEFTP
jgi:hypothetical protein